MNITRDKAERMKRIGKILSKQKRVNIFTLKEWILEKSEIRVNLEWTFVLVTHLGVTTGSLRDSEWSLRSLQNEWITINVHSKFTLISLFSQIHSLKSEHIHSFLFRE